MNSAVDELNKAFAGKYKILFTSKQGRTENIKKRITAYREQDNKDSKGTVKSYNEMYDVVSDKLEHFEKKSVWKIVALI